MKNRYLSCPWNTSLTEWYKKWFYVREESGSSTFCDVRYIPEKRVSWTDRLEFACQVEDLMKLIDWSSATRGGRQLRLSSGDALPEEGALGIRVC